MLTDIKDFTARTSSQTREQNGKMLALHDSILMPVIHGYGGVRRKTLGDAFLVTFRSPTDAVHCATAILDRLAGFNAGRRGLDRIEVRVALSMGDVRLEKSGILGEEADVVGEPLTMAMALEDIAGTGEVWLSDSVFLAMNRSEADLEEVGLRSLKGLREPRRLYRVRRGSGAEPYGGKALARLGALPPPTDSRPSPARRLGHAVARMLRRGHHP
jgi:class 3 adenylate cyclase